jgi:predicted small secreted protein
MNVTGGKRAKVSLVPGCHHGEQSAPWRVSKLQNSNKEINMNRMTGYAIAATILVSLSACNTTAGAGKDIKSAGNAIEKTAEKAKK